MQYNYTAPTEDQIEDMLLMPAWEVDSLSAHGQRVAQAIRDDYAARRRAELTAGTADESIPDSARRRWGWERP